MLAMLHEAGQVTHAKNVDVTAVIAKNMRVGGTAMRRAEAALSGQESIRLVWPLASTEYQRVPFYSTCMGDCSLRLHIVVVWLGS